MRAKKAVNGVFFYVFVFLVCFLSVIPVYILFKISVSSPGEVLTQHPSILIKRFTPSHWVKIFVSGNIWQPLIKSFAVSTITSLIALVIVVPAAYVVSRLKKIVKYTFVMALFFTRMFPTVGIALPISRIFVNWGLLDTYAGLVIANLITQIPFMVWILISTFETIPVDIEEAAALDGCSRIAALIRVLLPIAIQGIAVAVMYVWLNVWNEFTYAKYLSLSTRTMPLQIYYYVERGGFFEQAAYAAILAIPVIIITFVLQRYLKAGYLAGAVKG
jgi:trehalose transport system permease protein